MEQVPVALLGVIRQRMTQSCGQGRLSRVRLSKEPNLCAEIKEWCAIQQTRLSSLKKLIGMRYQAPIREMHFRRISDSFGQEQVSNDTATTYLYMGVWNRWPAL